MQKFFLTFVIFGLIFLTGWYLIVLKKARKEVAATVSVAASVPEYLTLTISSGTAVSFGDLRAGIPLNGPPGGTVTTVTSNNLSGYLLAISDGVPAGGSALVHIDGTTRIADYPSSPDSPGSWSDKGLGFGLFAADSGKDPKWGTGTSYNDGANYYAGIPENTTVVYTASGFHSGPQNTLWSFKIDIPSWQKPGIYRGKATFSATTLLL